MTILETKSLRKIYGSGEAEVHALDGVDLTVEKANFSPLWAPPVPANPPFFICWAAWTAPRPVP